MTHLYNDPATFMEDALAGFLDAYADRVIGVPGGVVRAAAGTPGKVAVVVGGGSGHYPAFCGVVGPGFADGAVVGNVFTSPSTDDAYHVAKAAHSGGGVLFSTGNYAGDVMNFDLAQQRLSSEGIDTRNVYVTDDVASAAPSEAHKRRGIAGDFVVFKVAGAAAERGWNLDEVERVARKANAATFTMGIGLDGCTMPGATDPLFHVPAGKMGVGLGIHGEPGIAEEPLPSAREVAQLLLDRVLAERPEGSGSRVAAILNGLGATKYEELFVVWATVAKLLREHELDVVGAEVGELVTSLDMGGISLTLCWLDDELAELWTDAADTPAYRKGAVVAQAGERRTIADSDLDTVIEPGNELGREVGQVAVAALTAMQTAIVAAEDELGRIDAIAGDGDHGRGMVKGITAATEAARVAAAQEAGVATILQAAGRSWAAKAGGTSGVLWGSALEAFGERLGDQPDAVSATDVLGAVTAFADTMTRLGKAQEGDKTMIDALRPFIRRLSDEVATGAGTGAAWVAAAATCPADAQATADLLPKIGRARPLAERSLGTPDAGAVSMAMCLQVVGQVISNDR